MINYCPHDSKVKPLVVLMALTEVKSQNYFFFQKPYDKRGALCV